MIWSQSVSKIRADGTILVDNVPFFPFGAYGLWNSSSNLKIQAINDLIAAGFNITTVDDDGTTASKDLIDSMLLIAENAGLNKFKIQIGVTHSPNITWAARKYDQSPATFGYTISDDCDDGSYSISVLRQREAEVKSYDNKHISFLTLTGWDATRRADADSYISISDACGYQCYPIAPHINSDWSSINALTQSYQRTRDYVLSGNAAQKPIIMHLQTFNWGSQSSSPRYPTVLELRNMLYGGLAAGIKGVLSYDFSFDLKNNQVPLWNEFKTLRTDVTTIESALMNGVLTRVNTGDQELVASYWVYNNICYMAVVNTSYTSSKTVSIPLPSSYTGTKTSLFSRMPNTLSVAGGNFTGTIGAQQVQVFSIAQNSDTTPPSVPGGLSPSSVTATSFSLSWNPSTGGATGYEVFRDGTSIGTTSSTSINVTSLSCNTSYIMTVKSFDVAGNYSSLSTSLQVTTSACQTGVNLLINPGFENGITGWTGQNCTLSFTTHPVRTGSRAGRAASRSQTYSGPNQDIKSALLSNGIGTYYVAAWVRTASGTPNAKITIHLNYGGSDYYLTTSPTSVNRNNWTLVSGTIILNWAGTLNAADVYIETTSGTNTFNVDDCILQKNTSLLQRNAQPTTFSKNLITGYVATDVFIYPNPATSLFVINNLSVGSRVRVINSAGSIVHSDVCTNKNHTVATNSWAKGVYTLQIITGNKTVIKKVVIQ